MSLNRRQFLKTGVVGISGLAIASSSLYGAEQVYPASTLEEAFDLAGFDPRSPGCETFVVAADCHYGMNTGEGLLPVIREVNAMRPRPAFFLVNGDLVLRVSSHFGNRPDARQTEIAKEELRAFKKHSDQLEVPLQLTLGNHDTHPGETDPEIFWSVFPGVAPYSVETLAGVNLLFLNGHSDGNLDPQQRQWLSKQVQEERDRNAETVIFVHQPALGSVAAERGIPMAIHDAFSNWESPLWLIGGHHHNNRQQLFRLPRTTISQQTIVCSADGIWGGPERPGYWIYGVKEGRLLTRVFRRLGHGYRVEPAPDRSGGSPLPLPYQNAEGLLWNVFVGDQDRDYRVEVKAGDVGSWLAYVKEVTYRLPLTGHDETPGRVGLLGSVVGKQTESPATEVLLSATGKSGWEPARLVGHERSVAQFQIPDALRLQRELFVKCVAFKEVSISGFSLWA